MEFDAMSSTTDGESSASIRARVVKARDIQSRRFADNPEVHCNAQMTSAMLRKYCAIDSEGLAHLKEAMTQLNMSALPTTASSKWRAPSPTSTAAKTSSPNTSPKPSATAALTEVTGENNNHRKNSPANRKAIGGGIFCLNIA